MTTSTVTTVSRARGVSPRAWWQLFRRLPVIPAAILLMLALVAVLAPWIAPQDPYETDLGGRNAPPTFIAGDYYATHPEVRPHLFGADYVGRDVLSRVIYGARISMSISAIAILAGMTFGSMLGMVAGYSGGWVDEVAMRLVDVWMSMPFILIALVFTMVFGASLKLMMLVLSLTAWAVFVRNVRAEALSLKTRDYVSLARVAGASARRIMFRHIAPNVVNTILVLGTLRVGQLILSEATLSFLGAGIPSPTPAWGLMVAEGRNYISTAWWTALFPGLFILMLVLSLNFIGDWLRDRFDPRLSQL